MIVRKRSIVAVILLAIFLSGCFGAPATSRNTPARIVVSEVGKIGEVSTMDVEIQSISGISVLREETEMSSRQGFYRATVYDNNNKVVRNAPITWALTEGLGELNTFLDPSIASIKPKRAGTGVLQAKTDGGVTGELELLVYSSAILGNLHFDGFSFADGFVSDPSLADIWIDQPNNRIRLNSAAIAESPIEGISVIHDGDFEFAPLILTRGTIDMTKVYLVKLSNQYAKLQFYILGGPTSNDLNYVEFMYNVSDNNGEFPY